MHRTLKKIAVCGVVVVILYIIASLCMCVINVSQELHEKRNRANGQLNLKKIAKAIDVYTEKNGYHLPACNNVVELLQIIAPYQLEKGFFFDCHRGKPFAETLVYQKGLTWKKGEIRPVIWDSPDIRTKTLNVLYTDGFARIK